jgi:hypothetical protein
MFAQVVRRHQAARDNRAATGAHHGMPRDRAPAAEQVRLTRAERRGLDGR